MAILARARIFLAVDRESAADVHQPALTANDSR